MWRQPKTPWWNRLSPNWIASYMMPMMLGFITSSIIGGQLLSRTGRYKVMALIGFIVASVGMFLLSRMTIATTSGEVVRNMIITGLGIGVLMSLFTIIVQNAFSRNLLGQVTSSITFFRSLGSSIGVAVLGAIVTNIYTTKVVAGVPTALKPYVDMTKIANLNGASSAVNVQAAVAHLGPQTSVLLGQLATNFKLSFTTSVVVAFTIGMIMMLVAFVTVLFLREIPLQGRKTSFAQQIGDEIGEVAPEPISEFAL